MEQFPAPKSEGRGMNVSKLVILIASVVGILSTFLPWLNAPLLGSFSGIRIPMEAIGVKGDAGRIPLGIIPLAIFLIPLVISIYENRSDPLIRTQKNVTTICGVLCACGGIYAIYNIQTEANRAFGRIRMGDIFDLIGVGLYLLIIAGVCVSAAPWFGSHAQSRD